MTMEETTRLSSEQTSRTALARAQPPQFIAEHRSRTEPTNTMMSHLGLNSCRDNSTKDGDRRGLDRLNSSYRTQKCIAEHKSWTDDQSKKISHRRGYIRTTTINCSSISCWQRNQHDRTQPELVVNPRLTNHRRALISDKQYVQSILP